MLGLMSCWMLFLRTRLKKHTWCQKWPLSMSQATAQVSAPTLVLDLELGGCSRRQWLTWRRKWDAYATRIKLGDEEAGAQLAALIGSLPDSTIEMLDTLPYESESDKQDLKKVLDLIEAEYLEEINETYESYTFFTRKQRDGEPIAAYINELKRLAGTCNFGTLNDRLVRDQIVCGISDKSTQRTLLARKKLTLTECVQICKTNHISSERVQRITAESTTTETTHERHIQAEEADFCAATVSTIKSRYQGHRTGKSANEKELWNHPRRTAQCQYCGRTAHSNRQQCPAYGKSCRNCGTRNHFAIVCRQARHTLHVVENARDNRGGRPEAISSENDHLVSNFNMTDNRDTATISTIDAPVQTTIFGYFQVNGRPTRFQLDSGASCNVLRESDINLERDELQVSTQKLRVYNGVIMRPLGQIQATIHNTITKESYQTPFLVVRDASTAILGAKTYQAMGLMTIHRERFASDPSSNTSSLYDLATVPELTTKTELMAAYSDIFSDGPGKFEGQAHLEVSPSAQPVIMPTRRVPLAMQDRLAEELTRLERLGIIAKQTEPAEWVSSIVTTEKRDGSLRICIDPLHLNKVLIRNPYPTTTMDDILPRLSRAKIFTVVDVKSGYWHVQLDAASSHLTTFGAPNGRYRWTRLPFGLSVAADIFQRKLDDVLTGLSNVARIVDDVIIWGDGDNLEDARRSHDLHVGVFFTQMRRGNVRLNAAKLKYRCRVVKFAGYILSSEGHRADPEKIRVIDEMTQPQNVTELRRFCGMVNYLAKYVQHLSSLMEPIHQLTRKDTAWEWTPEHERAFVQIKKALITSPTLAFFSNEKATTLQCDASQYGLGAVVLQDGKPVAYASRALTSTEQNYAQIEKELLAVLFGFEKFDVYTFGRLVNVESDHKPLQAIVKKPMALAPKRLQRMLLKLQRYNFELVYKKGTEMYIADTLSRVKHTTETNVQSQFEKDMESICAIDNDLDVSGQLQEIRVATSGDDTLTVVGGYIRQGWPDIKRDVLPIARPYFGFRDELVMEDGIVLKGTRLVIPSRMRQEILRQLHRSHMGIEATLRRIRDTVFWPGINGEMRDLISRCEACQSYKPAQQKETLQAHERPTQPWAKAAADLFTEEGRHYLITVDYCTNFWEVDYLGTDTSSRAVINKLRAHFARHGIPRELITDNGPQFSSGEFSGFARSWNFAHVTTSPYYPQANGQAESAVKTAKGLMKKA